MTGREIHLVARPAGAPLERDFALVEAEVPEPAAGQLLVRNTWMSLAPAQRVRMHAGASGYLPSFELHRPLDGWAVGTVLASRAEGFAEGGSVLHHPGWR